MMSKYSSKSNFCIEIKYIESQSKIKKITRIHLFYYKVISLAVTSFFRADKEIDFF